MADEGQVPATVETPAPAEGEQTFEDLLNFDPFAEAPEAPAPAPPAPAPAPAPPEPRATPAPDVDPGIPAEVPQAPLEPSGDVALRAEVARLAGIVEGYTRAQPAVAPAGPPQDDPFPTYDFTIPDPLMSAFASEDVNARKQGLAQFSKGLALGIHAMIRKEYRKAILDAVPAMIEQAMSGQTLMRQVFDDFYGTHKDLNRPELRPVVVEVAQRVWHGGRYGRNWNAQMRDAVANEVRGILRGYTPPAAPAVAPQPAMASPAARPPIDPRLSDPNAPENIERTLFG
jgi:hypothetical protein